MVWLKISYGNTRYLDVGANIPKVVSAGEHATVPIGQFLAQLRAFIPPITMIMDVHLWLHLQEQSHIESIKYGSFMNCQSI